MTTLEKALAVALAIILIRDIAGAIFAIRASGRALRAAQDARAQRIRIEAESERFARLLNRPTTTDTEA